MYCLDTSIVIDFLRNKMPAVMPLIKKSGPKDFFIPLIVYAELLLGAEKSQNPEKTYKEVEAFCSPFDIVRPDKACAHEYALIRADLDRADLDRADLESQDNKIGSNDLLIAAMARAHHAILVTNNSREFCRVKGLRVEEWAEVELPE